MDVKARAQFFGQDAQKTVHSTFSEAFFHPGKYRAKNKFVSDNKYNIL